MGAEGREVSQKCSVNGGFGRYIQPDFEIKHLELEKLPLGLLLFILLPWPWEFTVLSLRELRKQVQVF